MTIYLAIFPPLVECIALSLISMKLFAMSAAMAFAFGFVAVAVGPAIIIPILIDLQKKGYGTEQGIPTMMIASSSLSDIFSIIFYSLCSSLSYNQLTKSTSLSAGQLMGITIGKIIGGIVAGFIAGYLMRFCASFPILLKTLINLAFGGFFVFLNIQYSLSNADLLAVLVYGYISKQSWGAENVPERELLYTWKVLEPLLFGLVGASVNFRIISSNYIVEGVYIALIGIGVRLTSTFILMTLPMRYTISERIFMSLANLPRSSLQASLGP
jgi:NhaP-type Na+/H+ or K+/H+ antiporter